MRNRNISESLKGNSEEVLELLGTSEAWFLEDWRGSEQGGLGPAFTLLERVGYGAKCLPRGGGGAVGVCVLGGVY